jgi:hypothetical protein
MLTFRCFSVVWTAFLDVRDWGFYEACSLGSVKFPGCEMIPIY